MTFTLMPDATVVVRVKTKGVAGLAGVLHKKGRKPVPVELGATDVRFADEPAIERTRFIWKDTTADVADCLIGAQTGGLDVE